jgi:hypothetical protein
MKKLIVILVVLGGLTAFFVLEGRYLVEGGRAQWAVINHRNDFLKETLAKGASKEDIQKAFSRSSDVEAMRMLLAAGASPDPASSGQGCKLDSLAMYGNIEATSFLLQAGADPKQCRYDPTTLMAMAIVHGGGESPQEEIVRTLAHLIKAGGNPNGKSQDGGTPLEEARRGNLSQVVRFLENPGDVREPAATGEVLPTGKAGSYQLEDFKQVCAGKGLENAAPYVLQKGRASSLYYFERRNEDYRWPGRGPGRPTLPNWWTSWDEPANTQLVACVHFVDKKQVDSCHYQGAGGGITVYAATVEITLYEAKTGKKIAETSFKKEGPSCPGVKSGTDQEGLYPVYEQELKAFLASYVGGPA